MAALVLLPWATPSIVNGLMWKWIYNPGYGLLNGLLVQLGLIDRYKVWLGDPDKTIFMIANAAVWKQMPLAAILILVTMKAIPEDLYKAAKVDGANVFQRFWHVTLPALKPGLMLVLVYETMISIRHFDLFLIMTQGGPGDASYTLSWQIYVETFRNLKFGIGAALSYILALATFGLSYVFIRGAREEDCERRLSLCARMARKLARSFGRGVILALFSLLLVAYVAGPVAWLVSSSLQSEADITAVPPNWIPPKVTLDNFEAIFTAGKREVTYENRYQGDPATGRFLPSGAENLLPSLWNSFMVGVWVAMLNLLVSITAAYAIAVIHFRGRQTALYSILVTRVIPDIALIVPAVPGDPQPRPDQHAARR